MPESKSRKKAVKASTSVAQPQKAELVNPAWLVPTFLALMIGGLVWIVVAYLLSFGGPIPGIGAWNLTIGFVFIISGFMLTTRWR